MSEAYVDVDTDRIIIAISMPLHRNGETIGALSEELYHQVDKMNEIIGKFRL